MNRKFKKTLAVFVCLIIVSSIGFTTVSGYGSSSRSSRRTTRTETPTISTAPRGNAQGAGQVLGASTFSFNTNLGMNMSGEAVRLLQERLRAEGFFTFHTSTGFFGPITMEAVRAYQRANFGRIGYVTGFVGPLTRALLNI